MTMKGLLLTMMMCLSFSGVADAASIETLLMPGKLTSAHAKLETECSNCHDRTNKVTQTSLCLDCHKDIASDVTAHGGFHGRLPNASTLQCTGCHTEHKGRQADMVKLNPVQFDHSRTDFALQDAHASVACGSCHQVGKKYAQAPTDCAGCHKKVEPHQGQLGSDCGSCHSKVTWLNASFDHNKTHFALTNKHAQVHCVSCHHNNHYNNTPSRCVSCHAPDDVHRNSRGSDCGSCHSTLSWTTTKFDHEKETGFALLGAHGKTDCVSCHTSGRMQDKIPKDCIGCHQAQDSHAGRMGTKCQTCHAETLWKPGSFDHQRDARFALTGPHGQLACDTCHTANVATQKLGTTCIACHRADDAHGEQLGSDCDQCHVGTRWRDAVQFDHDLGDFPLLGLHTAVTCAQCHLTLRFKDAKRECNDCHRRDDVHKGGLGEHCEDCHSSNGWGLWKFDHNTQTQFPLAGAHAKLACADCHTGRVDAARPATDCVACHQQDDIHGGQFGRQCQRCHGTVTFRGGRAH